MSTKVIDWDGVGENSGSNQKGDENRPQFMKLTPGKYQVRLLGTPINFHKFVVQGNDGRWRSVVPEDVENNPVVQNHNLKPSERYAINVIDRADGEIKILEAGITVFRTFREFYKATERNPGASAKGADFSIAVQGAGRNKRYNTSFVKNSPLTDEEIAMIKERGGLNKLMEMKSYTPVPNDKIEEMLFGIPGQGNTENTESTVSTASTEGLGSAVPTNDVSGFTQEDLGDELPF